MKHILISGLVVLSLASCSKIQGGLGNFGIGSGATKRVHITIDGTRYRARANPDSADKRNFTISVNPAARNPGAAQEAGRYESVRYCLLTYGGSDTEWTVGPDTPLDQIRVVDDTLVLQGRCTQR